MASQNSEKVALQRPAAAVARPVLTGECGHRPRTDGVCHRPVGRYGRGRRNGARSRRRGDPRAGGDRRRGGATERRTIGSAGDAGRDSPHLC